MIQVKLTILTSFLYFAFSMLFENIFKTISYSFVAVFIQSIIFGVILSLVLIHLNRRKLNSLGIEEFINPHQSASKNICESFHITFEKSVSALSNLGATILDSSIKNGSIKAKFGRSRSSFGESLEISLFELKKGLIKVEITSRPKFKLTLLDFGKGFLNINNFFSELGYDSQYNEDFPKTR